jgi:hypothetical protein
MTPCHGEVGRVGNGGWTRCVDFEIAFKDIRWTRSERAYINVASIMLAMYQAVQKSMVMIQGYISNPPE